MCSGKNGGKKHLGMASLLHLVLDAAGQHRAYQFGNVAVETADAAQDPHSSLKKENITESRIME